MKTALIAHGAIEDIETVGKQLPSFNKIIAVDGGLDTCHRLGIKPDVIIGDFDSVDPLLLQKYKDVSTLSFPVNKDKTDLELAIEFALTTSAELCVYGALGKRGDHSLYNLILLTRYPDKVKFMNGNIEIFALTHQNRFLTRPGDIFSLLPMNGPVLDVTTRGLRWELKLATLNAHLMSISNEAVGNEVEITFRQGDLLCFKENSD